MYNLRKENMTHYCQRVTTFFFEPLRYRLHADIIIALSHTRTNMACVTGSKGDRC